MIDLVLRKLLFTVRREEWRPFSFMFLIVCLININFNILRSMRNALVVADRGGSAAFIPYFELFGTFPASILLTWGLSRLMRSFSLRMIFSLTMAFFLSFFLLFAFWIYPHREEIYRVLAHKLEPLFSFSQFKMIMTHWPDLIFYIMSELWKVSLLSVLFWGFMNQNLSLEKAKRFYPPLMLGNSIGTILAGPITVLCSSSWSWDALALSSQRWQHSLYLLTFFLLGCGLLTLLAFRSLFKQLQVQRDVFQIAGDEKKHQEKPYTENSKAPSFSCRLLSLSSSLRYLLKSPYLSSLLLIVVAEYISYALGELIFLEVLKGKYPNPSDYCQYMGNLTLWTGILTAFSALVLTPYILHKYRWSYSALITPVFMVLFTVAFFAASSFSTIGSLSSVVPISAVLILGSLHFCVGRAAKYTLFDSTKELAFVPLDREAQIKGKLIIDGIGSRLGRGTSSMISIFLFLLTGGLGESSLFAGIIAVSFALISIPAVRSIGAEFDKTPALKQR